MVFEKLLEKRFVGAALAGAVGLGALTGCGASIERDEPATVIQHVDHPAYTSVIIINKAPIIQFHPERFGLEVQQCGREGEEGVDESGCVETEVIVSHETYDKYPDGSTITLSEVE